MASKSLARTTFPTDVQAGPTADLARESGYFAAAILMCCLLLQRFAIPAGEKGVDIVGPIGLLLAAWALHRGALIVHRNRLILFGLLTLCLLSGTAWQIFHPNAYGQPFSSKSILQFLLLTGFCTLSFPLAMEEGRFYRRASDILAIVAIAGILQFVLQIAGLRLFAFTGLLPAPILFEAGYNLSIPVGIGSLLKSNGFFLLEPSIFSQVMAIGLIIELLAPKRRVGHACLFAVGLVLSFSGTGWIVLAGFFVGAVLRLGLRGIALGLMALIVLAAVAAAVDLLAPDVAAVFAARFGEISTAGTSGNLRFVTPYQTLDAVWAREPSAWLVGIGAGAAEHLSLPFEYNVNTMTKIVLEYGLPALILYVALILNAARTPMQNGLLLPSFVLLMLTGGYQEFAPVLFPIFLLICIPILGRAGAAPARHGS
jgi:hypothetical protein